jgi:hypothetical protein
MVTGFVDLKFGGPQRRILPNGEPDRLFHGEYFRSRR